MTIPKLVLLELELLLANVSCLVDYSGLLDDETVGKAAILLMQKSYMDGDSVLREMEPGIDRGTASHVGGTLEEVVNSMVSPAVRHYFNRADCGTPAQVWITFERATRR